MHKIPIRKSTEIFTLTLLHRTYGRNTQTTQVSIQNRHFDASGTMDHETGEPTNDRVTMYTVSQAQETVIDVSTVEENRCCIAQGGRNWSFRRFANRRRTEDSQQPQETYV